MVCDAIPAILLVALRFPARGLDSLLPEGEGDRTRSILQQLLALRQQLQVFLRRISRSSVAVDTSGAAAATPAAAASPEEALARKLVDVANQAEGALGVLSALLPSSPVTSLTYFYHDSGTETGSK